MLAGIAAVLLMWALYPVNYDYGQACKMSNFFYNAQRVGALPADNSVPWRSNSLLYETGGDIFQTVQSLLNASDPSCESRCRHALALEQYEQVTPLHLQCKEEVRWPAVSNRVGTSHA